MESPTFSTQSLIAPASRGLMRPPAVDMDRMAVEAKRAPSRLTERAVWARSIGLSADLVDDVVGVLLLAGSGLAAADGFRRTLSIIGNIIRNILSEVVAKKGCVDGAICSNVFRGEFGRVTSPGPVHCATGDMEPPNSSPKTFGHRTVHQKYEPNDTKFDSIRAQMSPNQTRKSPFKASNHNLSYQTVYKLHDQGEQYQPAVHSNHSKNTLDFSLIYWSCHSQKTIMRGEPKQGREEKEKEKLMFFCYQILPPRPPPGLPPDHQKEEKEEEELDFSCHQTPP
ncbi:hypothetical protein M5K25_007771 [Dendrobium thyrsiflorum]|uniref:Uncharacterized protein n=1 Tax=Dendrobium thyrsiflorum TaxID=117978 RepID=A0ABD0VF02_DENTH